ncbi:hypothetical protein [Caballeronia sp. Sq4a]|uniref:hypothetical protein n=1 Tax=Caballeronia sp. Sq4a TaxID=2878152 RepID=UPI0020BED68D|nr:hypothetical protein [Caballeronia sp. Sq4a]
MAGLRVAIAVWLCVLPLSALHAAGAPASCMNGTVTSVDTDASLRLASAAPVTRVLPAEGDARIAYSAQKSLDTPQHFFAYERGHRYRVRVTSVEQTTDKVLPDYPAEKSIVLHLDITKEGDGFPLWHRRSFVLVECRGDAPVSWAPVEASVSSPIVGLLWIPTASLIYALSITAVYLSRKKSVEGAKKNKDGLAEKYPSVFAMKPFEFRDFFNPIQLAANAFNQASVQKLQVLMFSFVIGSLVLSLVLRTGTLANMSATVVALLGISGFGATVSQITYTTKTRLSFDNWAWLQTNHVLADDKLRGPEWKDLVLTNREFDVYKLQTIIFSLSVAAALLVDGASNLATFSIPEAMLGVLGLSQVVFVGGILVRPPATEDLDKRLVELRGAAQKVIEARARNTDVDENGKLLSVLPPGGKPAENAARQYRELVFQVMPMLESTLEIEADEAALLDAILPQDEKLSRKALRDALLDGLSTNNI